VRGLLRLNVSLLLFSCWKQLKMTKESNRRQTKLEDQANTCKSRKHAKTERKHTPTKRKISSLQNINHNQPEKAKR
jgi:hypothetical protein